MGAYGSPELFPPSDSNEYANQPQKPQLKKCGGLKFAYTILLILTTLLALNTAFCFYCAYVVTAIYSLIPTIGLAVAAHMVHSNIDAVNVINGNATGRIHRQAIKKYRSNGTNVNYLTPESALAYFRYHPIKVNSAGKIIATAVIPFTICALLLSATPYMNAQPTLQPVEQKTDSSLVRQSKNISSRQDETEAAYKASCRQYTYEQIARNPNSYKGKRIKLTAKVNQIQDVGNGTEMLLLEMSTNSSNTLDGSLYALYSPKNDNEERILENDKVTLYGVMDGLQTYTTIMGNSRSVPKLTIEYRNIEATKK
jgi:hypothetical protein